MLRFLTAELKSSRSLPRTTVFSNPVNSTYHVRLNVTLYDSVSDLDVEECLFQNPTYRDHICFRWSALKNEIMSVLARS